jgi:UDP:flavonoid glycosyltransferase YjiC (YdhE family)
MHLLFLSRPDQGHLYPTLRLAEELGARGHRVTFASGDSYLDEAAESGVRLLRFGQYERNLLEVPAFRDLGSVDAVVCDPRTSGAATDFARSWQVPVVVAGTHLGESEHGWPSEQAHDPYVYALPGARGAVHDPWQPSIRRPVLLVDGPPIGALVRALGDTDWQVVVGDSARFAELPRADVFLTDGRLTAVSAGLRSGIPMLLAPRTAEEVAHAGRVVALGVGRSVVLDEVPAGELRALVEHLRVDEPTLATARRLRALTTEAGSPAAAAARLEDLIATQPLAQAA